MSVNRRWNIIGSDGDDSADRLSVEEHALDLSPELQTIADRLAGDAANLAAQFPPRQLTEQQLGFEPLENRGCRRADCDRQWRSGLVAARSRED